jgi:hypothetical protein
LGEPQLTAWDAVDEPAVRMLIESTEREACVQVEGGGIVNVYAPKIFASNTYKEQTFNLHGLDGISDAQITEHLTL